MYIYVYTEYLFAEGENIIRRLPILMIMAWVEVLFISKIYVIHPRDTELFGGRIRSSCEHKRGRQLKWSISR